MEITYEQLNTDRVFIGNKIRRARRWAEMTEIELGEALGLNPGDMCKLEKGKKPITLERFLKASEATGQSPWYFVGAAPLNEEPTPGKLNFRQRRRGASSHTDELAFLMG